MYLGCMMLWNTILWSPDPPLHQHTMSSGCICCHLSPVIVSGGDWKPESSLCHPLHPTVCFVGTFYLLREDPGNICTCMIFFLYSPAESCSFRGNFQTQAPKWQNIFHSFALWMSQNGVLRVDVLNFKRNWEADCNWIAFPPWISVWLRIDGGYLPGERLVRSSHQ